MTWQDWSTQLSKKAWQRTVKTPSYVALHKLSMVVQEAHERFEGQEIDKLLQAEWTIYGSNLFPL